MDKGKCFPTCSCWSTEERGRAMGNKQNGNPRKEDHTWEIRELTERELASVTGAFGSGYGHDGWHERSWHRGGWHERSWHHWHRGGWRECDED